MIETAVRFLVRIEMLLDRRDCQKRGDSDMVFVDAPVGEDDDIVSAVFVGAVAFDK